MIFLSNRHLLGQLLGGLIKTRGYLIDYSITHDY